MEVVPLTPKGQKKSPATLAGSVIVTTGMDTLVGRASLGMFGTSNPDSDLCYYLTS